MDVLRFLTAVLMACCSFTGELQAQNKNESVVVVTAKIKGLEAGHQLYYGPVGSTKRDSVSTISGGFNLRINIPDGEGDTYQFTLGRNVHADPSIKLYLEQGGVQITAEDAGFKDVKLSGSQFIQDYNDANVFAKAQADKKLEALKEESLDGNFDPSDISIGKAAFGAAILEWVKKHPASTYAAVYLSENRRLIFRDSLKVYFNNLLPVAKNNIPGKLLSKWFKNEDLFHIGDMAPDFTLPDTSGKPVSLKNYRGKYVLVDFWASWCVYCRTEHRNMGRNYLQHEGHNIAMIGISLDRAVDRAAWLKAIKDDFLEWTQVSDLKGMESEIVALYGIIDIPRNFLIDPQGKIVAINLRGDDLTKKLNELLADKS